MDVMSTTYWPPTTSSSVFVLGSFQGWMNVDEQRRLLRKHPANLFNFHVSHQADSWSVHWRGHQRCRWVSGRWTGLTGWWCECLISSADPDHRSAGDKRHEVSAAGHGGTLQQQEPGDDNNTENRSHPSWKHWSQVRKISSSALSPPPRASSPCLPRSGSPPPSGPSTRWFSRSRSIGWWRCRPGSPCATSWCRSWSPLSTGCSSDPRPITSTDSGAERAWRRSPGYTGTT